MVGGGGGGGGGGGPPWEEELSTFPCCAMIQIYK